MKIPHLDLPSRWPDRHETASVVEVNSYCDIRIFIGRYQDEHRQT